MGKSPQTINRTPSDWEERCDCLQQIRGNSKECKDAIVVRLSLFEGAKSIRGREHRITRYESFTYSRGELVHFTFFDSEVWDTLTAQERFLIEKGHSLKPEGRQ
jgi:hypothetical protein